MTKVSLPPRRAEGLFAARPHGLAGSKMSAARQVYDVIVVGQELGGAVAGALLARRGMRVLHVTGDQKAHNDEPDAAPPLLPPLKALPAAHAVLEELGLAVEVSRALVPLPRGLQLLGPAFRLDLAPEGAGRSTELRREFGAEVATQAETALQRMTERAHKSDDFFRAPPRLPPEGFFERFRFRGATRAVEGLWERGDDLDTLPPRHPVREAVEALWRFTSHLEPAGEAPLALARTAGAVLRAPHRFPGGRQALAELVRSRVEDHGGDILGEKGKPARVEELLMDGGRVAGVRIAGSANEYRARMVVLASDASVVQALVPPKQRVRRYGALEAVRPRYRMATLALEVDAAGLPEGLGEAALWLDPGDGPAAERAALLQVMPAERSRAPGDRLLGLAALYPAGGPDLDAARRGAVERLRRIADEVCPFVDRHLCRGRGPSAGESTHTVLEVGRTRYLSVTGLTQRTPYKGLLLASREVVPGLGVEGEFLAGRAAALAVEAQIRKRDPLQE